MAFLTKEDLYTHIYEEVIDAISDGDDDKLQQAIDAAVGEAKGYMSRFDIDNVFALDPKDPTLSLWIKDIAKFHFIPLANPNIDYETAESRYKMAIRSLEKIQAGKFIPVGWPSKADPDQEQSNLFHVASNPKRTMHR